MDRRPHPVNQEEVRTFCESVADSTTKSITLLKAIDQTVEWLKLNEDRAKADSAFASTKTEFIKKCERIRPIDPNRILCSKLEEAEQALERFHSLLVSKREAGRNAPELQGDDKETIVDAYTETISSVADLHHSMMDLRWAIGEYDADLEIPPNDAKTISSAKELDEFLKTL